MNTASSQNTRNGSQLKLGGFAPSNLEIALLKQYPFDSAVQVSQERKPILKKEFGQLWSCFVVLRRNDNCSSKYPSFLQSLSLTGLLPHFVCKLFCPIYISFLPYNMFFQRMTVVAKKKGAPAFSVFIKGAPEKVASLCKPHTSRNKCSEERWS